MSLAVFIAYYIYLEVSEVELDQKWKDKNIVDFCTFHDLLSNQMIDYNPTHHKYQGTPTLELLHIRTNPQEIIERVLKG